MTEWPEPDLLEEGLLAYDDALVDDDPRCFHADVVSGRRCDRLTGHSGAHEAEDEVGRLIAW